MSNTSEKQQAGYVTDPHTGKVYNLNPLFDYLKNDFTPLEDLHYRFSDSIHDVIQVANIADENRIPIKNVCFFLQNLSEFFRPESLFKGL